MKRNTYISELVHNKYSAAIDSQLYRRTDAGNQNATFLFSAIVKTNTRSEKNFFAVHCRSLLQIWARFEGGGVLFKSSPTKNIFTLKSVLF